MLDKTNFKTKKLFGLKECVTHFACLIWHSFTFIRSQFLTH